MKIGNEELLKQLFEVELSDFQETLGNIILNELNETNTEYLEALTTKIDTTLEGNLMYQVYLNSTLISSSERIFSLVNTYNIIKYGNILSFTNVLDG